MALLGSRKPTMHNLAAAPEVGSSFQRAHDLGDSAVSMAPPPIAPLNRAKKAPSSANGCRCNPEAGVGILAALMDPAAAHLRIAEPIRAGARGILEVTSDLCCNTPYCGRRKPFRIAESMLACNLCYHRIGSGPLYMYKGGMAFCKPECRCDYAMQELYKERQRRTITPAWKRAIEETRGEGKGPGSGRRQG